MAKTMIALSIVAASILSTTTRANEDLRSARATLAAHRQQQIARLHAYAAAGSFPRNYSSPLDVHMFKDGDGRLCAVANLVHQDGLDDLVETTARTQNDVVLAGVASGPLYDWALTSGLTMEEIARVQKPAPQIAWPRGEAPMVAQLREHFAEVERELINDTDASLDVAVARLEASRHEAQARQLVTRGS